MNDRNKELYLKSLDEHSEFCYQRFAELIRQDEREAIAKIMETQVELKGLETEPLILQFALDMIAGFAKFIRARGEK